MKKILFKIITALMLISFFTSCGEQKRKNDVVRMNLSSEPDSFFPWKSSAADTKAILFNIYEGLMTFDSKGAIKLCLAKKCCSR